jgi:putative FmdB family regulatory protein
MPMYQYRCLQCRHDFDILQKMSDVPLSTCPHCQGTLRRVPSPVPVVFKGTGFYSTDHRGQGGLDSSRPPLPVAPA